MTLGKMEDKSSGPRVDGPEEKGTPSGWLIALEANKFAGFVVLLTLLLLLELLLLLLFVMLEDRAALLLLVVLARLGR